MEVHSSASAFWWLKSSKSAEQLKPASEQDPLVSSTPRNADDDTPTMSSSLREFLEKERALRTPEEGEEPDIGSLIEEINKLAAQSPLGPYEEDVGERSVEEIMKEAEKIYMESSKSFEQLSGRSRTSANLSLSFNNEESIKSTPTPKSASPLPLDTEKFDKDGGKGEERSYSEDFTEISGTESKRAADGAGKRLPKGNAASESEELMMERRNETISEKSEEEEVEEEEIGVVLPQNRVDGGAVPQKGAASIPPLLNPSKEKGPTLSKEKTSVPSKEEVSIPSKEIASLATKEIALIPPKEKTSIPSTGKSSIPSKEEALDLAWEDDALPDCIQDGFQIGIRDVHEPPVQAASTTRSNLDVDVALERLKDSEESNTALRLQLDKLGEAHRLLKIAYDELLTSNKHLEERASRVESELAQCEEELENARQHRDKLLENERDLQKLLEMEKMRANSAKLQNEKDARCISDLNRQVKEMERIIARKHPDSVSALIVAAKDDRSDTNMTARKVLEDRIKALEGEVAQRDRTSSKVFLEVQEKFDEMKTKYESHIEDLELHVSDLKSQLKRRNDTFDVYTQTFFDEQKIPSKETRDASVQTVKLLLVPAQKSAVPKKPERLDVKEDARLLATIRGLQADLVNKDKATAKLQRELDEVKKTNKRLQKEREGNLKNLADGRRTVQAGYAEKIAFVRVQNGNGGDLEEELRIVRAERDKMKLQLCRMEEDYQNLKTKRLYDLSTLQQAHEQEMATYVRKMETLQEQVRLQQITMGNLQDQLHHRRVSADPAEKDDVNSNYRPQSTCNRNQINAMGQQELHEQEWSRLVTILQGISQRNAEENRNCPQCETRQEELIRYKIELDQLLSTLRKLT